MDALKRRCRSEGFEKHDVKQKDSKRKTPNEEVEEKELKCTCQDKGVEVNVPKRRSRREGVKENESERRCRREGVEEKVAKRRSPVGCSLSQASLYTFVKRFKPTLALIKMFFFVVSNKM